MFNIDKNEILRYLGYGGQPLDKSTIKLIDDGIEKLHSLSKPRYVTKTFDIEKQNGGIHLKNTDVTLSGKDIVTHLNGCERCVVLAATLGIDVDNSIRISQNVSMSKAVVLDACAVEFIEKLCDNICNELVEKLKPDNLKITSRFSPGYGDLSIEIQSDIIRIVDAVRKIGLTVTNTNIMIPRKSVTAIMGIYNGEERIIERKNCKNCNLYKTCVYRKRGVKCND